MSDKTRAWQSPLCDGSLFGHTRVCVPHSWSISNVGDLQKSPDTSLFAPSRVYLTHDLHEQVFSVVGSTRTIPHLSPMHRQKWPDTRASRVLLRTEVTTYINSQRAYLGRGPNLVNFWLPFHIQFGHLDILSNVVSIGRSAHDRHYPNLATLTSCQMWWVFYYSYIIH